MSWIQTATVADAEAIRDIHLSTFADTNGFASGRSNFSCGLSHLSVLFGKRAHVVGSGNIDKKGYLAVSKCRNTKPTPRVMLGEERLTARWHVRFVKHATYEMESSSTLTLPDNPSHESPFPLKRNLVVGGALLLILLIGWVDHASGWELSLFVFYAVPLLMVVWQGKRRFAIVLALLCGVIWWLANRADHPYSQPWSYHWASLGRTVYFVLVALGGNAIQARQESDRALISTLKKMRLLEREVVEAGEHEQQRIGRDLHDGLCQQLAAIGFAARSLADDLSVHRPPEAKKAFEMEKLLQDSVKLARDLARGICPVLSGGAALEGALDELARTAKRLTGMDVSFRNDFGAQMVDPEAAVHLYRIAQEALNNALHHSRGTRIEIKLCHEGETVRLTVTDDGIGIPAKSKTRKGMGMKTMEYRSHAVGGRLEIQRNSPSGTIVSCVYNTSKTPA